MEANKTPPTDTEEAARATRAASKGVQIQQKMEGERGYAFTAATLLSRVCPAYHSATNLLYESSKSSMSQKDSTGQTERFSIVIGESIC
eukprot:8128726-Ditylum_brightwellii.AAC.1